MSRDRIVIVPHDPSWPMEFNRECARLAAALGEIVVAAEHVGSTAISGLAAKPIVDIMIAVRSLDEGRRNVSAIEALGYLYIPKFEVRVPDRLFFQRGAPRTHHVHVVEKGSTSWIRQLAFRDYVRRHPEIARAYGELKRELAARFAEDRDGYTRAKTEFIEEVLTRAVRKSDE